MINIITLGHTESDHIKMLIIFFSNVTVQILLHKMEHKYSQRKCLPSKCILAKADLSLKARERVCACVCERELERVYDVAKAKYDSSKHVQLKKWKNYVPGHKCEVLRQKYKKKIVKMASFSRRNFKLEKIRELTGSVARSFSKNDKHVLKKKM